MTTGFPQLFVSFGDKHGNENTTRLAVLLCGKHLGRNLGYGFGTCIRGRFGGLWAGEQRLERCAGRQIFVHPTISSGFSAGIALSS
ncbi:hypothetical protein SAMN05192553_101637 [Cyclobacterium xiamenense]|uniref:Uncharacterized protein n=1 Tax=Cyclobacterium xiamenense TaxID=1297121 RepID=A0A1H6UHP6_9BACT|nr:hypothetical protein SAMN05192553_101637 [Cyclobacterium xiamenense]